MRLLLSLLAATTLIACGDTGTPTPAPVVSESTTVAVETGAGDAGVTEAVAVQDAPAAPASAAATATPRPAAPAASAKASGSPTTAQCRGAVGARAMPSGNHSVVTAHTFAATSSALGAGCFVTALHTPDSEPQSYTFSFYFTDADGSDTLALEVPDSNVAVSDPWLSVSAVSLKDLNGDDQKDVVVVHESCEMALAWTASGDRWVFAGGEEGVQSCSVDEAVMSYRAMIN